MNLGIRRFLVTCVFFIFIVQLANFAVAQPVKLAWDPVSATGDEGYNVYRSNRAGMYTEPALNGSQVLRSTIFLDSTAQAGQTYFYTVTTVSSDGVESAHSNEVQVVVTSPPASAPTADASVVSLTPPPAAGKVIPLIPVPDQSSGMAMIGAQQNRVLVSEAAIRAAPLVRTGRTYVEFQQTVNTGVALVNSNPNPVVIDFYFTDENGLNLYSNSLTLGPNANTIGFLNEAPFAAPNKFDLRRARTFTFSASAPVAFTAVRGFANERSEFVLTPLQVSAWEPVANAPTVIPYYTDGGPWTARVVLTNPSNTPLSGILEVFTAQGGNSIKHVDYVIPSASAIDVPLTHPEPDIRVGWIRITPKEGTVNPAALALLSFSIKRQQ